MNKVVLALDFLFGCHHQNASRVFTLDGQSYRVCCDCGARFKYSLQKMSVGRAASSWITNSFLSPNQNAVVNRKIFARPATNSRL
jgi:hypothetical protein